MLKIIVPSVIALIGTIITVLVGYRQWKRQQESSRSRDFLAEKQLAYKQLWEELEDVHIKLRDRGVDVAQFDQLVRGVNSHLLKQSLYIGKEDQEFANLYLRLIYELKELIYDPESDFEGAEFQRQWYISLAITTNSRGVVSNSKGSESIKRLAAEIREKQRDLNMVRDVLIERIRKILGESLGKSRE